MNNWRIQIEGRVQGVGFRPFVYQLVIKLDLKGLVRNNARGVEIIVESEEVLVKELLLKIKNEAPSIARIQQITYHPIEPHNLEGFHIAQSQLLDLPSLDLAPDFAICKRCANEIEEPSNRRLGYAFTTCTYCGPRYSITNEIPYDRHNTTMVDFEMCPTCLQEYQNPEDQRFHSQTNSCPRCKISLKLLKAKNGCELSEEVDLFNEVVSMWQDGNVIALKGLSGYLLTCSALEQDAINRLREIKQRPEKPFAIMCPDIDFVKENFIVNTKEEQDLCSEIAPIVLLTPKDKKESNYTLSAPGLSKVGVMIPYTPLLRLLLDKYSMPIVATSGNITNAPIIYDDQEAIEQLGNLVDGILSYNRDIVVPQDDSVIQFSPFANQRIVLRRSRGMAPSWTKSVDVCQKDNKTVLAMGADLKSSFAYLNQNRLYISQYLGDLSHFETQQRFKAVFEHYIQLFKRPPEIILADSHPGYQSTRLGQEYTEKSGIAVHLFQHHKAHFAAVLAEHDLLKDQKVLGVCWDGTGFGEDGNIWGGEFFIKNENAIKRIGHLNYFSHLAGNKMPSEPRLSALSLTRESPGSSELLREKFTEVEWKNYHQLLKSNTLQTSSVGRLFDGVSSLINICDHSTFEGQAAMLLEESASQFAEKEGIEYQDQYDIEINNEGQCRSELILKGIVEDLYGPSHLSSSEIAFKFHFTMVKMIDLMAERASVTKIAFSGGVFQNALLVDMIIHQLDEKFQLYFHKELSSNDENIALGQLSLYLNEIE